MTERTDYKNEDNFVFPVLDELFDSSSIWAVQSFEAPHGWST